MPAYEKPPALPGDHYCDKNEQKKTGQSVNFLLYFPLEGGDRAWNGLHAFAGPLII